MKVNKPIQKDPQIQRSQTKKRFIESIFICSQVLTELLEKVQKQLPPDTERVLTYSGLVLKETTKKIVQVNMLESEYFNNFAVGNNQQESFLQSDDLQNDEQNNKLIEEKDFSALDSIKKSYFGHEDKIYSPKFVEDEEIIRKKQGIKFIKKQEVKNLIRYRSSNTFSSAHSSYNPTYQRINTKHSLYHENYQKPQNSSIQHQVRSVHQHPNKTTIISSNFIIPSLQQVKSAQKLSTMQQINKNQKQIQNLKNDKKANINRQRISAMVNLGKFINLDEYYKQNYKYSKLNKNKIMFKENQKYSGQNQDEPQKVLLRINKNIYHPTWPYRESQPQDEDDIVINKLRDRKQKFYKSLNNFNRGSFQNSNQNATIIMNQSQKNSQKDQHGAIVAFDFNGQVMPTVKYETLKIAQHYQEMDFAVVHHDQSLMKRKKQRRGYMFNGAINLKLVDHDKFLPHPNYDHEPLIQKQGILMKQNIGCLLKKGVQVKPRQQNNGNSSIISGFNDQEQNRQRINKGNFQFLHNKQIQPKNVKFQQFLRYKKVSLSSNKNISSKKKISEQTSMWQESLLSKKSISIKGLKNRPVLEDGTNKVHKSTNPKALQMLMNANHNELIQKPATTVHFESKQLAGMMNTTNGVLKKSPHNEIKKLLPQNLDNKVPKKKVRIA